MKPCSISSTIEHRNRNIIQSFLQLRATGQYTSLTDIANTIATSPVSIHFISYRCAIIVYYRYLETGYPPTTKSTYRKQLYDSFIGHCNRILSDNPNLPTHMVVRQALLSPAPHIGINAQQVRKLLHRKGYK